jgi:hypothetical protein
MMLRRLPGKTHSSRDDPARLHKTTKAGKQTPGSFFPKTTIHDCIKTVKTEKHSSE